MSDDRTLVLTRILHAPRTRVFEAWTNPALIQAWWGPQGYVTEYCEMDIRPGGSYRLSMRSPQGTLHTKRGIYQEITAPERIVFTFAWEDATGRPGHQTVITVTLQDIGTATRLTLHQAVFESTDWCEDHKRGWSSCLERFAAWLTATADNPDDFATGQPRTHPE